MRKLSLLCVVCSLVFVAKAADDTPCQWHNYTHVYPMPYMPDYSVVRYGEKMGVVNAKGEFVLPPKYDYVELNAFGDHVRGRDGKLRDRIGQEKYTATMQEYVAYGKGNKTKKKWALAFAVDYNDSDNDGNPAVEAFELVSGTRVFNGWGYDRYHMVEWQLIPLYHVWYERIVRTSSSGGSHEYSTVRDYAGNYCQSVDDYKSKHNAYFFTFDWRSHDHSIPIFAYAKKGEKVYFDICGDEDKSYTKLLDKRSTKRFFQKIDPPQEANFDKWLSLNQFLRDSCGRYNNNQPEFVAVQRDTLATIFRSGSKYCVRGSKFKDGRGLHATADTIYSVSDRFYIHEEQGFLWPVIAYAGAPRVAFETIEPTDSGTYIATLTHLGSTTLVPPYRVYYDTSGEVIADNRMEIPSEHLAVLLGDNMMRGHIYAARASTIENTDRFGARELYERAYQLTHSDFYQQKVDEITATLAQEQREREAEMQERANANRAALADLAYSLQGLSNAFRQFQHTTSHRHKAPATTVSSSRAVSASSGGVSASSSQMSKSSNRASTYRTKTSKSTATTCGSCRGTGTRNCYRCGGSGTDPQRRSSIDSHGKQRFTTVKCTACHGSGKVSCNSCHGSGTRRY